MVLISCPDCHKPLSDRALTCPNCGYPVGSEPSRKRERPEVPRRGWARRMMATLRDEFGWCFILTTLLLIVLLAVGACFLFYGLMRFMAG